MNQGWITLKGFGCGDILNPVLRPQSAFIAEGSKSAFRGYSSPGQNDDPVDPFHRVPFRHWLQPAKYQI
jgi:hypothetical protein